MSARRARGGLWCGEVLPRAGGICNYIRELPGGVIVVALRRAPIVVTCARFLLFVRVCLPWGGDFSESVIGIFCGPQPGEVRSAGHGGGHGAARDPGGTDRRGACRRCVWGR